MPFLKIENIGVAPLSAFMLFGATTKRESDNKLIIGVFGSGFKHAIGVLLRCGTPPIVFCGNTKIEFYTNDLTIKSSTNKDTIQHQVCCRITGKLEDGSSVNRTEKLGFTLDYGTSDWKHVSMSCREFVSNALDAQVEATGNFSGVCIEQVDDNLVRAKKGHTRVFLQINEDIAAFYREIPRAFLHFSNPQAVTTGQQILTKSEPGLARIYRRGVYVRQISHGNPSIFDYNLEVGLDEARNFDDWQAKSHCATALRNASSEIIVRYLLEVTKVDATKYWEATFDEYDMAHRTCYDEKQNATVSENWAKASKNVLGDHDVFCDTSNSSMIPDLVRRKGFNPISLPTGTMALVKKLTIRNDSDVINENDKLGRTFSEATESVKKAHDLVWQFLRSEGLSKGKTKPDAKCFYQASSAGRNAFGYYDPDTKTCYYHMDYANGDNEALLATAVEECSHHATGASDFSTDFQEILTTAIARLLKKR